jgi:hypothetical protein
MIFATLYKIIKPSNFSQFTYLPFSSVMPTTQTISTGVVSPVTSTATPASVASTLPIGTHIVIHEYLYGDCCLYLGDRLVVVDNGDPDWIHGFKVI